MYDLNYTTLIGRLTRDPELRYTPNGDAVCNFSIANNSTGKEEMTSFFNIVAWGKTAENVSKFMSKGSQICIEGSLRQRRWQDQNGNNRALVEVLASRVHFIGGSKSGSNMPNSAGTSQTKGQDNTPDDFSFPDNNFDDPIPY
jgi:single-strand DNA-binding protein